MSTSEQPRGRAALPPFVEGWLSLWSRSTLLLTGGVLPLQLFGEARKLRSLWMTHLSEQIDRQLRSPLFLQSIGALAKTAQAAQLGFRLPSTAAPSQGPATPARGAGEASSPAPSR